MLEAFDRVVVQVDVRNVHIIKIQAFRIHRETVILGCDLDLLAFKVQNGMIPSVMSEFQLECPAAERESHNLVAKTNSEDRLLS